MKQTQPGHNTGHPGFHKNSKLYNYKIDAKDLGQTHTGSLIFMIPYEPWLVDSEGHVLGHP